MLPIFDSLAHPTLSGRWLESGHDSSFEALSDQLDQEGFSGACAVGISGVEGYEHQRFIIECKRFPKLIPIAGVGPECSADEIKLIAALGFKGIKLHPRFSGFDMSDHEAIARVIRVASRQGLVCFVCTYMWCGLKNMSAVDPLHSLIRALEHVPDAKVVLVHGGGVDVLRFSELVRFNPNLLLDLSMTILKYRGSSIDSDISYLFKSFDRRICVGTDHPEYSHAELRNRVEELAEDLSADKLSNIAENNIKSFLGLTS